MNEEEKKKIRPLYREFQDYLSQAPTIQVKPYLYEPEEWEHFNHAIDLLNTVTGKSYDRFKVAPEGGREIVSTTTYRANLGGIIGNLHGEFFSDEPARFTFSGSPSSPGTIINNQNSQTQSQHQQQEQKIELEQMVSIAQEMIQAEYGEEQAKKASDLIKQIISNPKNWAIIATSIVALAHIGHVAFVAALPILGKILLEKAPVKTA